MSDRGSTGGMRAMFWSWMGIVVVGFATMLGVVALGR
jgi:hypothetical protein